MPEPTLTVGSDTIAFRVTTGESEGAVVAYDAWLPPGGGPPALHRHAAFELFRVERGELAFYLEDADGHVARAVACAGDVVAIPGGREHTVRNESTEQAQAFVALSPGAAMEGFARAAAALAGDDVAEVLALAARHGIEITRPLEQVAGVGA